MRWVTRASIRVNRTATCWLVRRFIDPSAEFVFVAPEAVADVQRRDGAIGFDAPGARYPHQDDAGRCSFAALVHERLARDPALVEMARIVQAADVAADLATHPAGHGLRLISQGFPAVAADDHDTVERAAFLYDALYASIAADQARTESR